MKKTLYKLGPDLTISLRVSQLPRDFLAGLKFSENVFTDHSKAVLLMWIICAIYVLYLSCFRIRSLLPCGHLLGKG